VPRTPDYVDGVANLRGVVLPIVDTRTRFGMPRIPDSDRTRVLIVDIDGTKTGLRVDQVRQVTRISQEDLEHPPAVIRGIHHDFLEGVVKLDGGRRIIMALRPGEVCQIKTHAAASVVESRQGRRAEDTVTRTEDDHGHTAQIVTFRLAREEFAFPIDKVREILRVEKPSEVPDTPPHVLGVLTVRGRILPIIDLRRLLHQPALAEEMRQRTRDALEGFGRWAQGLEAHGEPHAGLDASGPEALRAWIAGVSSSNQSLTEKLARLRALNDRILRLLAAGTENRTAEGSSNLASLRSEGLAAARSITSLLSDLEGDWVRGVRDDQRIIVIEVAGMLLGLVVDHVNEVLNVPRTCIDPPPPVTGADGLQLSGIAKLQKGERLIMLLDASHLLDSQALPANLQSAQGEAGDTPRSGETRQAADHEEQQLVTFLLGEEEYGIPISRIQEIDRCSKITKVPRAASFVEGVTNLRGEIIPVIDTRKRFELPARPADDSTRVIIVDLAGVKTGLLVDSVREVLSLSSRDISPPPAAVESGVDTQFIAGIGKVDEGRRMVVLLDIERILSRSERRALDEFAAAGTTRP